MFNKYHVSSYTVLNFFVFPLAVQNNGIVLYLEILAMIVYIPYSLSLLIPPGAYSFQAFLRGGGGLFIS